MMSGKNTFNIGALMYIHGQKKCCPIKITQRYVYTFIYFYENHNNNSSTWCHSNRCRQTPYDYHSQAMEEILNTGSTADCPTSRQCPDKSDELDKKW